MQKNQNPEKITFKVVQMKISTMHITDQKLSFKIFMGGNSLNIFMEHIIIYQTIIFVIKYNFDPYNVFLAIATNIPQQLKTGFVVQGHKREGKVFCQFIFIFVMFLFPLTFTFFFILNLTISK